MLKEILQEQNKWFASGASTNIDFRKEMLSNIYKEIETREKDIYEALKEDLNKSETESYLTEVSMVKKEIRFFIKKMSKLQRRKTVKSPLTHWPSKSYIYREPFGTVLIMSPWNYPFQLAMLPLVGAIAGGNCGIVKLSSQSKKTGRIVRELIETVFPKEYVYCVSEETKREELLRHKYDLIFFTGSTNSGKQVMRAAAENLTPVVLELGGKSPCIVDKTGNIDGAARKIVWGKLLNCGQTCVAPDYILVHRDIKAEFVKALKAEIKNLYGDAINNESCPHIINAEKFRILVEYIQQRKDVYGGKYDEKTLCIEPTILEDATWDDEIMTQEIFGPILPIIEYSDIIEIKQEIQKRDRPLALYLFSEDAKIVKEIIEGTSFGGGCINDVVMQVANENLPFGGVGASGMGVYHGRYSFETFTRLKGIEKARKNKGIPLRYPPYTSGKMKIIKKILK